MVSAEPTVEAIYTIGSIPVPALIIVSYFTLYTGCTRSFLVTYLRFHGSTHRFHTHQFSFVEQDLPLHST